MVAHTYNTSTQEADARESLSLRPAWSMEGVQDIQEYTEKHWLKIQSKQTYKNATKLLGDAKLQHP